MKRNNRGFTLIELLAVIVILGLLMAIAIPSVTKYITQSRKKTITTTIGNYISALVNEVNDLNYTFTETNMIYAVPIECISLERGGTNPFGEWHQVNDSYWAYVLVQYDDQNSKYIYGYTFKDSASYGLYPTIQSKLKENGSQIKTGLELKRPKNGLITNVTSLDNWHISGFKVDENTQLKVLIASSEGEIGDGKKSCTLAQKGNNYNQAEEEKKKNLSYSAQLGDYVIMTPTSTSFTTDTTYTGYSSKQTINPSELNLWRVIKKNDDGTIEMVSEYISTTQIYFQKMIGYTKSVGYLNIVAKQYENSNFTIGSRAMGYNGQTEFLNYSLLSAHETTTLSTSKYVCKETTIDNSKESIGCGDILYQNDVDLVKQVLGTLKARKPNGNYDYYILASRHVTYNASSANRLSWRIRWIKSDGSLGSNPTKGNCTSSCLSGWSFWGSMRPIIILKADLQITSGDGTSSSPYQLSNE